MTAKGVEVRLAIGGQVEALIAGLQGEPAPAVLASYHYLRTWLQVQPKAKVRNWAMDSGAFSVDRSGATIDLRAYTETARELLASDASLVDVFALDVIGNAKASLRNAETMRASGVPKVIPCFHVGEPMEHLRTLAKEFDKIALGGAVGYGKRYEWACRCFDAVWPKKIHGFGFNKERDVLGLPWHSVDATTWCLAPVKFGRWTSYGQGRQRPLPVRKGHNLTPEVRWFLRIERQARLKWASRWKELEP
jgi:hypothetical protein